MARHKRKNTREREGRKKPGQGSADAATTGDSDGRPVDAGTPGLSGKRPVLKAVAIFVVLMGLFHALAYTPIATSGLRQSYIAWIAEVSGWLLNVVGYGTTVVGTSITSPRFSVGVVRGCDALLPTAAFVAAVVASPVPWAAKLPGIVLGTVALLTINLVRIVSLFAIGVHFPSVFHLIHFEVWQAVFIVLAIVQWAIWVQWATRPRAVLANVSS